MNLLAIEILLSEKIGFNQASLKCEATAYGGENHIGFAGQGIEKKSILVSLYDGPPSPLIKEKPVCVNGEVNPT